MTDMTKAELVFQLKMERKARHRMNGALRELAELLDKELETQGEIEAMLKNAIKPTEGEIEAMWKMGKITGGFDVDGS